jgi:RecJ-like exonuclease
MSRFLYEDCPLCKGVGRIEAASIRGFHMKPFEVRGEGIIICPACDGRGIVKIGLTAAQVEAIIAENDRLKAMACAPKTVVIIPSADNMAIDLHACDVPRTALDLSRRLVEKGRVPHSVHRVASYHVHYAGKEWTS